MRWIALLGIAVGSSARIVAAQSVDFSDPLDTIRLSHNVPATASLTVEARIWLVGSCQSGYANAVWREQKNSQEHKEFSVCSSRVGLYLSPVADIAYVGTVPTERWVHIACQQSAGVGRIWIDGVLVKEQATTTNTIPNVQDSSNSIGAGLQNGSQIIPAARCRIDWLRVSTCERYSGSSFPVPSECDMVPADSCTALLFNFGEAPGTTQVQNLGMLGGTATVGATWFQGATAPTLGSIGSDVYACSNFVGWGAGLQNLSTDPQWGQAIAPNGNPPLVGIAAGGYHNISLTATGAVIAWGKNSFGQCNVPANLGEVAQVAAGAEFSVVLKVDGTVAAWGSNSFGQCNVPVGLAGIIAVEAGNAQSVALRATGTVVCWGNNTQGQLNVPTGLTSVTQVDSGANHIVVRKSDGTAVAWGDNTFGQRNVPAGLSTVVQVAGGGSHSVAVRADGTVVCWGNNGSGQCNPPAGMPQISAVSAGGYHTVALSTSGSVIAWGGNGSINYGQASVPSNLPTLSGIAAGGFHSVGYWSPTPPCPGDITGGGEVNGIDLAAVLGAWGTDGQGKFDCDVDNDGIVNGADLATVLSAWGPCPN
jgi:hypothetical protein